MLLSIVHETSPVKAPLVRCETFCDSTLMFDLLQVNTASFKNGNDGDT